ncbi:MAG: alpha/beta hydrolase [Bacteroidia bacterium]
MMVNRLPLFILAVFLGSLSLQGQKKIEFPSKDGIEISATVYILQDTMPYMILCHQAGYSRGEYEETARKFMKFQYNCLAIDLRSGGEINDVKNETAQHAKEKNKPVTYLDAEQDMLAAIDYAFAKSKKKVILIGSSYSASLALKIAASKNEKVKAVIAFSPGEYFGKTLVLKDHIKTIPVPVFVTSSKEEAPALTKLMNDVTCTGKQQFIPASKGEHGSRALWKENQNAHEYWLAVLMFMRGVK